MASINFAPLCDIKCIFVDALVEEREDDKPARMIVNFSPAAYLGKGTVEAATSHALGQFISVKMDSATWLKVKPLLIGKQGEHFDLSVAPEPYSVGGKSGIWYRFHSLEPSN